MTKQQPSPFPPTSSSSSSIPTTDHHEELVLRLTELEQLFLKSRFRSALTKANQILRRHQQRRCCLRRQEEDPQSCFFDRTQSTTSTSTTTTNGKNHDAEDDTDDCRGTAGGKILSLRTPFTLRSSWTNGGGGGGGCCCCDKGRTGATTTAERRRTTTSCSCSNQHDANSSAQHSDDNCRQYDHHHYYYYYYSIRVQLKPKRRTMEEEITSTGGPKQETTVVVPPIMDRVAAIAIQCFYEIWKVPVSRNATRTTNDPTTNDERFRPKPYHNPHPPSNQDAAKLAPTSSSLFRPNRRNCPQRHSFWRHLDPFLQLYCTTTTSCSSSSSSSNDHDDEDDNHGGNGSIGCGEDRPNTRVLSLPLALILLEFLYAVGQDHSATELAGELFHGWIHPHGTAAATTTTTATSTQPHHLDDDTKNGQNQDRNQIIQHSVVGEEDDGRAWNELAMLLFGTFLPHCVSQRRRRYVTEFLTRLEQPEWSLAAEPLETRTTSWVEESTHQKDDSIVKIIRFLETKQEEEEEEEERSKTNIPSSSSSSWNWISTATWRRIHNTLRHHNLLLRQTTMQEQKPTTTTKMSFDNPMVPGNQNSSILPKEPALKSFPTLLRPYLTKLVLWIRQTLGSPQRWKQMTMMKQQQQSFYYLSVSILLIYMAWRQRRRKRLGTTFKQIVRMLLVKPIQEIIQAITPE